MSISIPNHTAKYDELYREAFLRGVSMVEWISYNFTNNPSFGRWLFDDDELEDYESPLLLCDILYLFNLD